MKFKNMKTFEEHSSELNISDVMNSNSEYRTIRDMRFELRMSGVDNIKDYTDEEVVELFNKTFGKGKYIGIDSDGKNINYCS